MRTLPAFFSFALFFLTLLGWRLLYLGDDLADWGLLSLAALTLLSLIGGYRIAVGRRRALVSASVLPSSGLRSLLTGRIGASLRAIMGTAVALPVIGYFSLTASQAELFLAAAAAAWAIAMTLVIDRASLRHLRPAYRMSLVAPAAIWVAALPVVGVAVWFSYAVFPIPEYARATAFSEALRAAVADLPRHHSLIFETLSALRSAEAVVYWVLVRDGFQATLPLALFLLKGAITYVSITKVAVDCQAAFYSTADT